MNWSLKTNTRLLIGVTSVISAAIGAAATYFVTNKLQEKKFDDRLTTEIAEAKSYYQQMYSTPTFVAESPSNNEQELLERVKDATDENDGPPEDLVGKALNAVRTYEAEEDTERSSPVIIRNVFANPTEPSEAVLAALLNERDPSAPYIITKEEFFENAPDFEQKQFTYYEGDDILVDDQDEFNPIMDNDLVAGEDNLLHFGYGSEDEFVVYVRNETLDPPMDLYITKSTGKYSVEVMAIEGDGPHLQHSQIRKFRNRDD